MVETSCRRSTALALAGWLFSGVAAGQVEVAAPAPLDALLERHLSAPGGRAGDAALAALRRDAQRTAAEILATEGYFSPQIDVRAAPGRLALEVVPGPRTTIVEVAIEIDGEVPAERRADMLAAWPLAAGEPFRDEEWRAAKQLLLRRLLDVDYAGARLVDSRADIDPGTAQARLRAHYEAGPRYVFSGLRVEGLERFEPALVARYARIEPGGRYDKERLLGLQAALQRSPYFSSVSVELGPALATGAEREVAAPVVVHVRERQPHRISFGAGVSTNTGAQVETVYHGIDFLHRAWQFDAGVRLEQLRQSVFAEVGLPPEDERRDSFGVLADWEDIQGLERRRVGVGAVRSVTRGPLETRYAVNWQREIFGPEEAPVRTNTALTADAGWILRRVDAVLDPRRGFVAQLQAGGGSKALLSDQNFLRLHARYQHFFSLTSRDVLQLRGELGATLAPSREGIPQDFLFRAGGAQSVRGYAYQSLGVREGDAVVGGRYLAVASAEYTHWFTAKWGAALFVDAGNAGDDRDALKMARGYGAGARWQSPAGPLAVDVAYGEQDERLRLHFSLAIAF